jgi:hypothetical protein
VNFRHLKESRSLHLEEQIRGVAGANVPAGPGTPGYDDGMDVPADGDLFGAFNSVTLHYDGES